MRSWIGTIAVGLLALSGTHAAGPSYHVTRTVISSTPQEKTNAFGWYNPRLSPDGRAYVFSCQGDYDDESIGDGLIRWSDGRSTRTLAQNANSAAWSPHGKRILYLDEERRLWTVRTDGTDAGVRAEQCLDSWHCDGFWSPRGHRIAYVAAPRGHRAGTELRAVDPDGDNPQTLLVASYVLNFSWSADSRHLTAWSASPQSTRTRAFLVEEATGRVTALPSPSEGSPGVTILSPDNRYLAMATFGPERETEHGRLAVRLWLQDRGSRRWQQLAKRFGYRADLAWASDGTRLAATVITHSDCSEAGDLAIFETTGGRLSDWMDGVEPRWSPGGKRLAFKHYTDGHGGKILACDNVGERLTMVGEFGDCPNGYDWTPDGMSLIISMNRIVERVRMER